MKLQYLGTAAAEGWPALFCTCDACKRAREKGGRNIRTRSQAIIDGKLLIDFPADTYYHFITYNINMPAIASVLVTHSHEDHLYPMEFGNRRDGFSYLDENSAPSLTVYGTRGVLDGMARIRPFVSEKRLKLKEIKRFETYEIEKYRVTPLAADHDRWSDPVIYIISDGEKTMLYANDTGRFKSETMDYIRESGVRFDYVSLDCTGGLYAQYESGHMATKACAKTKDELVKSGAADEKTVFCLNHFSHNGKAIYDEIVGPAGDMGFLVSYDGMEIEF